MLSSTTNTYTLKRGILTFLKNYKKVLPNQIESLPLICPTACFPREAAF